MTLSDEDVVYLNSILLDYDSAPTVEEKLKVLENISHPDPKVENYLLELVVFSKGEPYDVG